MRVGAFKPYHHCWRFAVFAVVVFAALAPVALAIGSQTTAFLACAANIAFIHGKETSFILAVFLLFVLFALPAVNSLKNKTTGQILPPSKICPTKNKILLGTKKEKEASLWIGLLVEKLWRETNSRRK